ncbi:hypothetical protein Fmac_027236 [Flemingia macrophylla]|uniref:Uncharacterized protein n=1 Tax=Flemingia macrophylla TaxID=520843 RepID=A0ABD1LH44_9FABA
MATQRGIRKERKLRRYLKAPLRFLRKARDMYVHGTVKCSAQFSYLDALCPTGPVSTVPTNFNVNSASSQEDFKELVRAASLVTSSSLSGFDEEAEIIRVPRSRSMGIGTIDENKPCVFDDDDDDGDHVITVVPNICPRSKHHATRRRGASLF